MQDLLRRWRDNPNAVWGIGYLGLVLLVFLLVSLIGALFGNSPEERQGASSSIAEETTVEEKPARERTASKREKTAREAGASSRERTAREEAAGRRERTARDEPPVPVEDAAPKEKPKPIDPDERIRFNLEEDLATEVAMYGLPREPMLMAVDTYEPITRRLATNCLEQVAFRERQTSHTRLSTEMTRSEGSSAA